MNKLCLLFAMSLALVLPQPVRADTFGTGENAFEIEFVTIGDPGNAADDDPNPSGAVDYVYRMGKYEVSEQMIEKANTLGGLGITIDDRGPDKPATSVTWFEAARFVNWLNTSTGRTPAYKFDDQGDFQLWEPSDPGYNADNRFRNSRAFYFLPSDDEWHKAAYYDPMTDRYFDYPTGSDSVPDGIDFVGDPDFEAVFFDGPGAPGPDNTNPEPNDVFDVGLQSPFATAGQGGNVAEWEESAFDLLNSRPQSGRGFRGGGWGNISSHLFGSNRNGIIPTFESDFFGFRVASIPEPTSGFLVMAGLISVQHVRVLRRDRRARCHAHGLTTCE